MSSTRTPPHTGSMEYRSQWSIHFKRQVAVRKRSSQPNGMLIACILLHAWRIGCNWPMAQADRIEIDSIQVVTEQMSITTKSLRRNKRYQYRVVRSTLCFIFAAFSLPEWLGHCNQERSHWSLLNPSHWHRNAHDTLMRAILLRIMLVTGV